VHACRPAGVQTTMKFTCLRVWLHAKSWKHIGRKGVRCKTELQKKAKVLNTQILTHPKYKISRRSVSGHGSLVATYWILCLISSSISKSETYDSNIFLGPMFTRNIMFGDLYLLPCATLDGNSFVGGVRS
jgi:hypothetical protein